MVAQPDGDRHRVGMIRRIELYQKARLAALTATPTPFSSNSKTARPGSLKTGTNGHPRSAKTPAPRIPLPLKTTKGAAQPRGTPPYHH